MGNSNKSSLRKAQSVPDTQRLPPDAPVFMKVSKSQSQQRLNQSLGKSSGGKLSKLHKGHSKSQGEGLPQLAPAEAAFLPDFPLRGDLEELDFEVIDVIAKGAYGNVIKVQREDSKRFYAMKVLDKQQIINEGAIRQCKDEAAIQSMAGDHPLVVKVHEYWQSHLNLYIVLDYIPHGDMFTLWTFHGAFPESLVQLYIAEMAMVIDYLHNSSVIYRDIKMENILFDQRGHIQLTDFGLSKWLQGGDQTRTVCGTLQYMAPEVLSVYPYTHSADWWSLGILMFAMLAGRYPVDGADTHTRMAQRVFECDYLLPSNVSDAAQDVINRVLTKSPHKRLGDMYTLQDLDFFQDVFFPDLFDKKINPIDVVPSDFFPMTGESWAPHLLTEEERRNFDQFDKTPNNDIDHRTSLHKRQQHQQQQQQQQYSSHRHHPSAKQAQNHHILRQQSNPEQLHNKSSSNEDSSSWRFDTVDFTGQQGNLKHEQSRASYKQQHNLEYPSHNQQQQSRELHQRAPHQQEFESVKSYSSDAETLRGGLVDSENVRRGSQQLYSNLQARRSVEYSEWESEPRSHSLKKTQQNAMTFSQPYSNTIDSAEAGFSSGVSPSAYKSVEQPPTIELKASPSFPFNQSQPSSSSGFDHSRLQRSTNNRYTSNQTFGYLGPGPPFNTGYSNTTNTISQSNSGTGASSQPPHLQKKALDAAAYSTSSKPALDYKTVEAPPTITLPTVNMGPTSLPLKTENSYNGSTYRNDSSKVIQFSGPLATATQQYKKPPPVPAKPVVPAKPQVPVRPQPAPRKSLQGSHRNTHSLPSTSTPSSSLSTAIPYSSSQSNASNYNRDFVQNAQEGSNQRITESSYSPRQDVFMAGSSQQMISLNPSKNDSFDQANFSDYQGREPYGHLQDTNRDEISRPFTSNGNRYLEGNEAPIRSPTGQSNFKWKLPANVAPSFV